MLKTMVLMLAMLISVAAHCADDWQGLNSWLGKYPSEKQRGSALLEQTSIKAVRTLYLLSFPQATRCNGKSIPRGWPVRRPSILAMSFCGLSSR